MTYIKLLTLPPMLSQPVHHCLTVMPFGASERCAMIGIAQVHLSTVSQQHFGHLDKSKLRSHMQWCRALIITSIDNGLLLQQKLHRGEMVVNYCQMQGCVSTPSTQVNRIWVASEQFGYFRCVTC